MWYNQLKRQQLWSTGKLKIGSHRRRMYKTELVITVMFQSVEVLNEFFRKEKSDRDETRHCG
jgi:hypothetical protein